MIAVRILIASYFLASGTGLIIQPPQETLLGSVVLGPYTAPVTTIFLYVTAFLIMVGKAVRPAALLLAVYLFWSGFLGWQPGAGPEALSGFWRDMALLGAVLLIAVTEPGGKSQFRLRRRSVAPRRIAPATRPADAPKRLRQDEAARARMAVLSGDPTLAGVEGEISNIFGDIWDTPFPTTARTP